MKTRYLGKNRAPVSELGLGCMRLSTYNGVTPDEKEMIALIHGANDLGFTMFDTAQCYGPFTDEELVGKALCDRRDKVFISTKCGRRHENGVLGVDNDPKFLRDSLEGSLRRLRTDYVDLYYLHRYNAVVPIEVIAETMKELIQEGKIRGWGVCETSVETVRRAQAICPMTAVQFEYSMMTRDPEHGLLDALDELEIGLVPFSPLCRGFLTGAFTKDTVFAPNDTRSHMPRFDKDHIEANLAMVQFIRELAGDKHVEPTQIALAWLLHQRPYIAPIPSSSKLERLKGFVAATEVRFTPDELAEIHRRLEQYIITGGRYGAHEAAFIGH